MAVTTGPRTGATRWSAGTDPFTRAQLDAAFASFENLMALDAQGTLANRPVAGVRGRYYFATDNSLLYRDTGSAWVQVGSDYGTPGASAVGDTSAAGTATTAARSDHKHAREPFGTVVAQSGYGAAATSGSQTSVARSDHAHGTPALPTATAVGAIPSTGGTYTGSLTAGPGAELVRPVLASVREKVNVSATAGLTIEFAVNGGTAGNTYRSTIGGQLSLSWLSIPGTGSGLVVGVTLICAGPSSILWPAGTRFNTGAAPTISGETWFSIVATEGTVTVAKSFEAVA